MKSIQIKDSYNIWNKKDMQLAANLECFKKYKFVDATKCLNRSWRSIYIEWFIHNIGYYLTLPFIRNWRAYKLNLRFKDVDLEEHSK